MKKSFKQFAQTGKGLLKAGLAVLFLVLCGSPSFVQSNQTSVFLQATQKIPNFGGMTVREDGKLLICGYNKNVRVFNPATGQFEASVLVLDPNNFSFPNDITIIPANPAHGFVGGFSCSSFLDGRIWTKLNDGSTLIESNVFVPVHATNTGVYDFTYDQFLQGAQPIAYRKSDDRLYTQSGFDKTQMWKMDWRGISPPTSIPLSPFAVLNTFQFGPGDKLYAPDVSNGIVVKVDVDGPTGIVTPIATSIPVIHPISLRIKNNFLYILSRTTGEVYTHDLTTGKTKVLTTLEPALADLTFNLDKSKLYVTNDQSTIYEVNPTTGANKVIFHSPIVGPWDLAYDSDKNSLYVADNGSLREVSALNAQPIRKLTLDTETSGLSGFGLACGIQVEQGPIDTAEIVISDITVGDIAVVMKKNFKVKATFPSFETGILQVFSAVHVKNVPKVNPTDPTEFYLAASPTDGNIYKLWRDSYDPVGALHVETYVTGLTVPVKLKVRNGFLYIVDAGEVLQNIQNTGSVSRVQITQRPTPDSIQVLVTGLNKPEGFDLFDNKMLIVEADSKQIVQYSATAPSPRTIVQENLKLEDGNLIYQFAPVKIHPFIGLACDPQGKNIFVNQSKDVNILKITRP